MRYLLLIHTPEAAEPPEGSPGAIARRDAHIAFGEASGARGVLRSGERLHRSPDARTVRVRDGKTLTVDGPFAETREQLGGFYILECAEAEAIELAATLKEATYGSIELRPMWDM